MVSSATRRILRRIDRAAAMGHLALRQGVAHEHGIDGLQIVFGGQVHDGEILVVEFAVLLRRVAVALHQIAGTDCLCASIWRSRFMLMKPCELQEARIDVAHEARMRERHLGDDVAAEPVDAALLGQRVDRGRIDAGVDRAAHQHHGVRHVGIVVRLHQRDRRQHRHRRLAHRDDMRVAAEECSIEMT